MPVNSFLYRLRLGGWDEVGGGNADNKASNANHAERMAYKDNGKPNNGILLFVQDAFPCAGNMEDPSQMTCNTWLRNLSGKATIGAVIVRVISDEHHYGRDHGNKRAPCTIYYVAGQEPQYDPLPQPRNGEADLFHRVRALPAFPEARNLEAKQKRTAYERKFDK